MNGFALALGIGAVLGLLRVSRQQGGKWLDAGLLVLLGVLLGARLGYVLLYPAYYAAHPQEILALKAGGLSGVGAAAGWAVGLACAALITRTSFLRLADWLYPLLPPLAVAGYIGCWLAGAAYGYELMPGTWWGVPSPDELGRVALRLPLQPAAALALFTFYLLMEALIPLPRPSGWLASLAAAWYAAVALVVSLLRADPQPTWLGMRADTLGSLVLLAVCLGIFTALSIRYRRKAAEIPRPRAERV